MMPDIVFVRTRVVYDSYLDFWHLVELSGFSTIYVDEVDISEHVIYITTPLNGEWRPHIDNQSGKVRRCHTVHWNLERPSGSGGVGFYAISCEELISKRYFDEVWVSDKRLADETHTRFVVLGSDDGLGEPGNDKRYDFCHMSYIVPRRQAVYDKHPKELVGPNCWPPERDDVLKKSKFALNIHQDIYPFQEPLRFALFAAYGLPILTETIYDSYPFSDEFMVYNTYIGIMGRFKQMLANGYDRWRDMGLRARDRMCGEFRFVDVVKQAVHESITR